MTPEEMITEMDRLSEGGSSRFAIIVVVRNSGSPEHPQDSIEPVKSQDSDRLDTLKKKIRAGGEPVGLIVWETDRAGQLTAWSKVFDETNQRHVMMLEVMERVGFMDKTPPPC